MGLVETLLKQCWSLVWKTLTGRFGAPRGGGKLKDIEYSMLSDETKKHLQSREVAKYLSAELGKKVTEEDIGPFVVYREKNFASESELKAAWSYRRTGGTGDYGFSFDLGPFRRKYLLFFLSMAAALYVIQFGILFSMMKYVALNHHIFLQVIHNVSAPWPASKVPRDDYFNSIQIIFSGVFIMVFSLVYTYNGVKALWEVYIANRIFKRVADIPSGLVEFCI